MDTDTPFGSSELPADDAEVMRIWRECGLPEYFLGNGGSNHRLVAFAKACAKQVAGVATEGQGRSEASEPSSSPDPIRDEIDRAHRLIHAWCDSAPESPGCIWPECDCGQPSDKGEDR